METQNNIWHHYTEGLEQMGTLPASMPLALNLESNIWMTSLVHIVDERRRLVEELRGGVKTRFYKEKYFGSCMWHCEGREKEMYMYMHFAHTYMYTREYTYNVYTTTHKQLSKSAWYMMHNWYGSHTWNLRRARQTLDMNILQYMYIYCTWHKRYDCSCTCIM